MKQRILLTPGREVVQNRDTVIIYYKKNTPLPQLSLFSLWDHNTNVMLGGTL
jgi:hypothetical protein